MNDRVCLKKGNEERKEVELEKERGEVMGRWRERRKRGQGSKKRGKERRLLTKDEGEGGHKTEREGMRD